MYFLENLKLSLNEDAQLNYIKCYKNIIEFTEITETKQ